MTRILVISQYFYPEPFRINDICKEWVKRGYEVTVVTGIPNYPEGKFYKDYGLFKNRKEQYEGVRIIRLPLIPRGKTPLMLVFNYLSFVVTGGIWQFFTKIKADYVFVFEVSPMTQALPGVWYARKQKIPCYLYMQDLWPDNVEIVTGIGNRYIIGGLNRMVHYIYRKCTRIFVTSDSFAKELVKRGVQKEKVSYWPQYAEDCYIPAASTSWGETFKIIFTGNIGYAQGLDVLPMVGEYLRQENVQFILVGDGRYKTQLQNEVKKRGLESIFQFINRCPAEKIPEYMAGANAAFISFMSSPLFEMTIPAKLQSYMACGMPIIAAANGETKQIIEESCCGICSPLGDAEQLAESIRLMRTMDIQSMRNNSLKYSSRYFNKEELLSQMDYYFTGK